MLKHRSGLAAGLLKGSDPVMEDPEGWGGGGGATVSERAQAIAHLARSGARDAFRVDVDGSAMMRGVVKTMMKLRIRQERRRRRAAGMDASSSDEDGAMAAAAAEAEGELAAADGAVVPGGPASAAVDAGGASGSGSDDADALAVEGVTLSRSPAERRAQLRDIAARTGRDPDALMEDARANAALRRAERDARKRPGKPAERRNLRKAARAMRSGALPDHPASGYVAAGAKGDDDTTAAAEAGSASGGAGSRSLRHAGTDKGDRGVSGAGAETSSRARGGSGTAPKQEAASARVAGTAAEGGGQPAGANAARRRGSVAGALESTIARATAKADDVIHRATLAAVTGKITEAEALHIAFNASATVGLHAGDEADGGALGESVEDALRGLGVLSGRILPQRRYSFASESSVEYEGKARDEEDAEKERAERVERMRRAAETAAAEVAAAAGTPPKRAGAGGGGVAAASAPPP